MPLQFYQSNGFAEYCASFWLIRLKRHEARAPISPDFFLLALSVPLSPGDQVGAGARATYDRQ